MLRSAVAAACLSLLAAPVLAAETAASNSSYVDITPMALPIVQGGRVVNYVFVSVRLWARSGTDVTGLRAQEPYFRDAVLRSAYRTSYAARNDLTRVDEAVFSRAVAAEATRIAGRPVFQRVEITSQQPMRRHAR